MNDNAVINNNYGRLQDLILLFKIPMGTRKELLKVYVQLRHAPPESSPALSCPSLTFHCAASSVHTGLHTNCSIHTASAYTLMNK